MLLLMLVWTGGERLSSAFDEKPLLQKYLALYTKMNDAVEAERRKDNATALKTFKDIYAGFTEIHESNPEWETALVIHRVEDCWAKIIDLEGQTGNASGLAPLFIALSPQNHSYPWKGHTLSQLFWIGESYSSAWNKGWEKANHGTDLPDKRDGYGPAGHAFRLNPFYVALPFNDLAFPNQAQKWLPPDWLRSRHQDEAPSACQHRWVEIKSLRGDICYAQWEDVGPGSGDNPEYVFANAQPKAHAGICLSPAVGNYLDTDEDGRQVVSWRFVDPGNVAPGAWLKYNEEAVLFRALHQLDMAKSSTGP